MGRGFDINHAVDYALVLLDKETGNKEGHILAYYTKGGTCHAMIELFVGNALDGAYHGGDGTAEGGGYDRISAAIYDALTKARIAHGDVTLRSSCARFTGCAFGPDETASIAHEQKAIPVYAGTGNQVSALEIWWRVVQIV